MIMLFNVLLNLGKAYYQLPSHVFFGREKHRRGKMIVSYKAECIAIEFIRCPNFLSCGQRWSLALGFGLKLKEGMCWSYLRLRQSLCRK